MPSSTLKVDLHAHSWYSADSIMSPRSLVRRARAAGLDRIAVTDHGAIAGALEAATLDPELVIPGEEISCRGSIHLIGLFLTERIPNRVPVKEAAQRIRDQGGVVYAPHPFSYPVGADWRAAAVLEVADVVEVFNARAFAPGWNERAAAAARDLALPGFAGTDAHFESEVGRAHTELDAFTDAASFLAVAQSAVPRTNGKTPVYIHGVSVAWQVTRLALLSRHGSPPPFFR
jgi:predicted metal-dependent phosphoesterase TrpH